MNGQPAQTYPVALVVALVGVGPRDWARESGAGEEIALREMMGVNDGTSTEIARREDPAEYPMLEVNLQNLGSP